MGPLFLAPKMLAPIWQHFKSFLLDPKIVGPKKMLAPISVQGPRPLPPLCSFEAVRVCNTYLCTEGFPLYIWGARLRGRTSLRPWWGRPPLAGASVKQANAFLTSLVWSADTPRGVRQQANGSSVHDAGLLLGCYERLAGILVIA